MCLICQTPLFSPEKDKPSNSLSNYFPETLLYNFFFFLNVVEWFTETTET